MIDASSLPHDLWLVSNDAAPRAVIFAPMPVDVIPEFRSVRMQIARPPHLAEREELDAALSKGTLEALLLFVERHPQSRYRPEAEKALRLLGARSPSR